MIDEQVMHRTNDILSMWQRRTQILGKDKDGNDISAPLDGITKMLDQQLETGIRAGMLIIKDLPRSAEEFWTSIAKECRELIEQEEPNNE